MIRLKKKKIIFLSYSLCIGGIEKALVELLNRLDYSKYDVTLLLEKKEGELLNKINNNVKIYNYNICNSKNIIYRKIRNGLKRLKYLLFNYMKYDFACCYATYSKPCSLLALKSSKNTALYVHGDYSQEFNDNNMVLNFFEGQDIYNFKNIIFVSKESKDNLIKIMPSLKDKSIVINNFINNIDIINLSNEKIKEVRNNDRKLLLYVGRLDEKVKQVSKMIYVVEYLKKNNVDVDFWIVGDGPDYKYYDEIIKTKNLEDNIKMLGSKLNPYPYMKICDYLVITSLHEGFPVTFLEALTLDKKIISTIAVSDDEIELRDYGYIISHNIDKMKKEVFNILTKESSKNKKINFDKINNNRLKKLESIIEGDNSEI